MSSWGTPRGNGCTSVLGVWAAALAFVVASTVAACAMKDDAGTDHKADDRCGELTDGCSP